MDERINDLQTRLARKKQLNQQLATQSNIYAGLNQHETLLFGNKSLLRNTNKIISNSRLNPLSNVATVEPLPRFKIEVSSFKNSFFRYLFSFPFYFSMIIMLDLTMEQRN